MASPNEPHFIKPLLLGFDSGVPIPLGFYSKHVQGNPHDHTWKLKIDASERMWEVKQEGRRLTFGWKEFTMAHDLRVGDILIFKHQEEMVFEVTPFGPSCCEIQYTHPHIKEDAETEDDDVNESGAMSYDYCFKVEVTASNVQQDKLCLPVGGTTCKALSEQCQETILVNKEGKSWTANLRFSESGGYYYITKGWRNFCDHNGCAIGDLFVFNVVGDGKTSPLMCQVPLMAQEILKQYKKKKRSVTGVSSEVQAFSNVRHVF